MRRIHALFLAGFLLCAQVAPAQGASKTWTYTDTQNAYSWTLPAEWKLDKDGSRPKDGYVSFLHVRTNKEKGQRQLMVTVTPTRQTLVSAYLKQFDAVNAHNWEGQASLKVSAPIRYGKIAGLNAIIRMETLEAAGIDVVSAYMLKNKRIYRLTISSSYDAKIGFPTADRAELLELAKGLSIP